MQIKCYELLVPHRKSREKYSAGADGGGGGDKTSEVKKREKKIIGH